MKYTFKDLVDIMARLRSENGCPWDRQQTTHSLLPYLVEESCEFIDAAQDGDKEHMCEELGDVLFQVVFHSQVCKEQGDFTIDDVIQGLCEKMVRRHPHVFGDAKVDTANDVSRRWERIKAQEKNNLKHAGESIMDKVSKSMPTLARSQDIIRRVAKVGFDWGEPGPVFDKAHFKNVIYKCKKMLTGNIYLFDIIPYMIGNILFVKKNMRITYNCIHRCTDIM